MLFNSLTFVFFFAITLGVLYLLPPQRRNAWILFAGFVFYASWGPQYILLLLATAAIDFLVARKMGDLPTQRERRPWLIGSLIFSIGSLLFFKYTNMLLDTAGLLAGWVGHLYAPPHLDIILPLGISFYTFETISYGIDVYRGELVPKRSFVEYLSFLMFFPKLIAGPIVRASELLPQIGKARAFDEPQLYRALNLLCFGFVKKVLLADGFAPFVEQVFAHPSAHNRAMCIVAAYGYSMQVYFDFSAYTDLARGCALLMGYELPINFDQPYKATSISDFWRRWHMTLSRWLRDYFYIPIGGNAGGNAATYRNLMATMLVGGLWHGANWTFVAWGALNGLFLVGERAWYALLGTKPKRLAQMTPLEAWLRRLVVFNLIAFTRIFFRSPTFATAIELIGTIIHPKVVHAEESLALFLIPVVTAVYIACSGWKEALLRLQLRGWERVGYAAVAVLLLLFGASQAEFIYFQF